MKTIQRIVLSFGCMLISVALYFLRSVVFNPGTQLKGIIDIFPVTLVVASLGWILALPFVVAIKDAKGWRAWFILITGIALGPGPILLWSFFTSPSRGGHVINWQGDGFFLVASLMISAPTTLLYVLALKWNQRQTTT
jgi:hypothetical protein